MWNLRDACSDFLLDTSLYTDENWANIWRVSVESNTPRLRKTVQTFILDHMADILVALSSLDIEELLSVFEARGMKRHSQELGRLLELGPLPNKRQSHQLHDAMVCLIPGVFGDRQAIRSYSESMNTWFVLTRTPDMPQFIFDFTTTVVCNSIFFVGGWISDDSCPDGEQETGGCCKYHPPSDTWFDCEPLINARAYHEATCVVDKLLILGGKHKGSYEATYIEIYDPLTNQWSIVNGLLRFTDKEPIVVTPANKSVLIIRKKFLNESREWGFQLPCLWKFNTESGSLDMEAYSAPYDAKDVVLCNNIGDFLILVFANSTYKNNEYHMVTTMRCLNITSKQEEWCRKVAYDWYWGINKPYRVKRHYSFGLNKLYCVLLGFANGERLAKKVITLKLNITDPNSEWVRINFVECPQNLTDEMNLLNMSVPLTRVPKLDPCRLVDADD